MVTPATAEVVDRKASEIFIEIEFPTRAVSADNRLISSPVLCLSKNAISCLIMDEKT